MHTEKINVKLRFIYTALIFLALGLFTSPTILAGYHIFLVVPGLIIFWDTKSELSLPKSSYFLLFLALWGLMSAFYNLDTLIKPSKSFQELKYYILGVLGIYPLRFFYHNVSKRHFKIILNLLCITLILAFIVGLGKIWFQFNLVKMSFGEYHNRSGGFLNYMRYGYGSALLFILGLGMTFNRDKLKDYIAPKLFYPALTACFLAIPASQCRGALLGILVSLPFMLFFYKRKLSIIFISLGSLFALIIIYFSFVNQSTQYRFLNINQGSNAVRSSQWLTAIEVIKEKPFFGLGPDQFSYNVKEYKKKYNIKYDYYSGHTHNILMEHGASYGVVGIICLVGFLLTWFIEMYTLRSSLGIVVGSYIIAFFIAGQVELLFDTLNSHLLFFIYSLSQAIKK